MSKTEELPKDIVELSFEDALSELEGIVSKLEAGDVGLEQSIDIYTRGTQFQCEFYRFKKQSSFHLTVSSQDTTTIKEGKRNKTIAKNEILEMN